MLYFCDKFCDVTSLSFEGEKFNNLSTPQGLSAFCAVEGSVKARRLTAPEDFRLGAGESINSKLSPMLSKVSRYDNKKDAKSSNRAITITFLMAVYEGLT